jgi:3-deoxy-D-manno-octulosonate 8-phosphate phosphatase (KDO 8-P phosphatase)
VVIDKNKIWIPRHLILDVDGVFTDGKIYYSETGKFFKVFGPDDHDAIDAIREKISITIVSADSSGLAITKRRIEGDLKLEVHLVGSKDRASWIAKRFDPAECVYMGDGIFDPLVFKVVHYSIAPSNASQRTRTAASFVTEKKGSEGAVAEAIIHLADKFLGGFDNLNR